MSFLPGGAGGFLGGANVLMGVDTSRVRGQVRSGVRAIEQELGNSTRGIEESGKRASRGFSLLAAAAKTSMFAIAGIVGVGVGAAIQFESAWAGVRKTVDATPERLAKLRQEFRDLAKEIPVSVNELAKIGETAGALGIATDSILDFTKTVALLGQTTDVSTDEAATALGQLSNVLNMTGEDYGRFASTLVDLGNKGASTESQILAITSRAGAGAALIGFSTKQTLAWASSIASLGIEVEAGGSSLQNFFLKAQKLVNDPNGLKTLASVAGMTGKQFKTAFEKDASGALLTFITGLGKLKASDQLDVLDALKMNDIRITRGLLGLAGKPELLANNLNVATEAWKNNTAATAEAEKRFETTASTLGLLKNVIQDYFIEAGDQALPFVKALLVLFRDQLPKAINFLAGVWNEKLLPPLEKLGKAAEHLFISFGRLFGAEEGSDWAKSTETAVEGLASALGHVVNLIATLVDGIATLLSNPVIGGITKVVLGLKALAVAIGVTKGAIGGLNSMSRSALRTVGLGGIAGGGGSTAGLGENRAATALTGSASNLTKSAAALEGAAGALRGAAAGGAAGYSPNNPGGLAYRPMAQSSIDAFNQRFGGAGYGIQYGQNPAYSRMTKGGSLYDVFGKPLASGLGDKQAWLRDPNFGRNLAQRTMGGIAGALTSGLSGVKNLAQGALGLVGKAFWPIMIATVGAEFVKAPLGDFIANNTQFKRAGALIKEDFFGGLIGLVKSWVSGSDLQLVLPTIHLGKTNISTAVLKGLDIDQATIDELQAGGVRGALAETEVAPAAVAKLQRQRDELISSWYRRVIGELEAQGVDTSTIEAAVKAAGPRGLNSTSIGAALQTVIDQFAGRVVSETGKALQDNIVTAVKNQFGNAFTTSQLINLGPAATKELAGLLGTNERTPMDPRLLRMGVSGIVGGGGAAPIKQPDIESLRGAAFSGGGLSLQADRAGINNAQKALNEYIKSLNPDQAYARELGLKVLASLDQGIKAAGDDKGKQKAFLASINKALGLTGADKMTWDQLIDWQKQLGEDTGQTAQRQLNKRMKNWAVVAAREGATGGAAEFVKLWGKQVAAAGDDPKALEALRKKINAALPGKADDIDKDKFKGWLKDTMTKGAAEAETARNKATEQFWSGGLKNPDTKDSVVNSTANSMSSVLKQSATSAANDPDTQASLWTLGVGVTKQIAAGMRARAAIDSINASIAAVLRVIAPNLPGSPVKKGPLKHPYLINAGKGIVDQIGTGMMKSTALSLPKLDLSNAVGATGTLGGRAGKTVNIYADKLQTFTQADERSLAAQFEFLAADGR